MKKHKLHKKHKGERRERSYEDALISDKPPALKLILKVGGGSSSTPEHSDSPGPSSVLGAASANYSVATLEDESSTSLLGISPLDVSGESSKHKKAKKKKKKKDRDRDKHEKKHKHHHKERKKRPREESSQDDVSLGDESNSEIPHKKAMLASPVASLPSDLPPAPPPPAPVVPAVVPPVANIPPAETASPCSSSATEMDQSGDGPASREPRACVLRQRQEHGALYKLLDYLLKVLEKKDPQHFFAWPVTDNIAPGYSSIINQPMDFSTMRQKNEESQYASLPEFMEDFKLMCQNAMVYNQQETIYYRAAKRLMHGGVKVCTKDKLKPLLPTLPFLAELSPTELGFELHTPEEVQRLNDAAANTPAVSAEVSQTAVITIDEQTTKSSVTDAEAAKASADAAAAAAAYAALEDARREIKRRNRMHKPVGRYEAFSDDMTSEEILVQARQAAQSAAEKLAAKKPFSKMGFLRTNKDGTTSLAILCGTSGVFPGTNEQAISIGALAGKLPHGTGQLAGFREDKRNVAKTVKPLYYGAFGSYAPSYDSTFANLTKEESDLVYSTYGDETGFQYAESILDFARDSDFTLRMVDDLLDLLTGGEHMRTVNQLGASARRKRPQPAPASATAEQTKAAEKFSEPGKAPDAAEPPPIIDMNALKGLSDLGIDMDFLKAITPAVANPPSAPLTPDAVQASLDQTSQLIGQLQKAQRDRLSQPPPPHLALVTGPTESEVQLAEKITDNLTDLAKQVTPESIAPACVVRKAMGVDMVTIAPGSTPPPPPKAATSKVAEVEESAKEKDSGAESSKATASEEAAEKADAASSSQTGSPEDPARTPPTITVAATSSDLSEVPDLESELREFLENTEPTLSSSPLQDEDRTIEEILSES